MSKTYHYNIPKRVIHTIHMVISIWLVYIGYKRVKNQEVDKTNYKILLLLGQLLIIYFSILLYKNYNRRWNYALKVPNYIIHLSHIVNGILFVLLGLKKIELKDILSLYIIIYGSMGGLYHLHLMYL